MVRWSRTSRPTKKPGLRGNVLGAGIGPWWDNGEKAAVHPMDCRIIGSQRRAALAAIGANTPPKSIGELEIALGISAVAVCSSRASASWRLSCSTDCSPPMVDVSGAMTLKTLDNQQN